MRREKYQLNEQPIWLSQSLPRGGVSLEAKRPFHSAVT
jgi:hypothetical protein